MSDKPAMKPDPGNEQRSVPGEAPSRKPLTAAAQRALDEAAERRAKAGDAPKPAEEVNGPKGPEPTRYGDWEKKGVASDF